MDIKVLKPRAVPVRKVEVVRKSRPPSDHIDSLAAPRVELMESWPVKCAYVVNEILATEVDYLEALEEIMKGYKNPLAGHLRSSSESHQLLRTIFCNIEELHHLHSVLFDELKANDTDPDSFGRVFTGKGEEFSLYTEYCTNYDRSRACLQRQTQANKEFEGFLKTCQAQLGHDLPLSHQLIKPVQRIMKYHLLLREVLKSFDPNRHGYLSLSAAHSTMSAIASRINEVKKLKENRERVKDLQTSVVGWDKGNLSAYGELILEGSFKVGRRGTVRQVLLFEKLLLVLKKKEGKRYNYKGHLLFSEMCMEPESMVGESNSFKVFSRLHKSQSYEVHTTSVRLQKEWVSKITTLSQRKPSPLHVTPSREEPGVETEAKRRKLDQPTGIAPQRATPTKQDHRYQYASSQSRRVLERTSRKRSRPDVRSLFIDRPGPAELKSVRHTYTDGLTFEEGGFDAIFEEPMIPETAPASSSAIENIPEARTAPYQVSKTLSSSQSSDSLLELSDVEFAFDGGTSEEDRAGEIPITSSHHLEDIEEVDYHEPPEDEEEEEEEEEGRRRTARRVSQLQRKAAIKVKKAKLTSAAISPTSSFSGVIKLRAQEVREASKSPRHRPSGGAQEQPQAGLITEKEGDQLDDVMMAAATVEEEFDSILDGSQSSFSYRSSADDESSLADSGGYASHMYALPEEMTDSGLPDDHPPLRGSEERPQELALNLNGKDTPSVIDVEGSEVANELLSLGPGVEIDTNYVSSTGGGGGGGAGGGGGGGSEGGEDDFVILNEDSSSESELEELDDVLSCIDEVGDGDIIPPPSLFAELGHQEVSMATQALPPQLANEETVSQTDDVQLTHTSPDAALPETLQTSPGEVELPSKPTASTTAEPHSNGTLPRKQLSNTTPTQLQESKKLATSTATLSRMRQQGFSRLLEFTKQQATTPVSRPAFDMTQSLPVGMMDWSVKQELFRVETPPSDNEKIGLSEDGLMEAGKNESALISDLPDDRSVATAPAREAADVNETVLATDDASEHLPEKEEEQEEEGVPYTLIGEVEEEEEEEPAMVDPHKTVDDELQQLVTPSEADSETMVDKVTEQSVKELVSVETPQRNDDRQDTEELVKPLTVRQRLPHATEGPQPSSSEQRGELRARREVSLQAHAPGLVGYLTGRWTALRRLLLLPSVRGGLLMLGVATIASLVIYTVSAAW